MRNKVTNNNVFREDDFCLTEKDFCPPEDNRVLKSLVRDIHGGDNFANYSEYIFDLYESEDYYEN